jgi:pseudaminic acid cytidylyltransferase
MRIAIIPARGGSKRIPRKNLRAFLGVPIIAYPIAVARESGLFDRILVSTDDEEIAELAETLGAEVPFRRPAALSDDHASTISVIYHALAECEIRYGPVSDGCCIYPATPLLTVADLERGLELLCAHSASSAFPVVPFESAIEQAFILEGDRPVARWPDRHLVRSQDLRVHYHDAGMFYWFNAARIVRAGSLHGVGAVAFAVPPSRCHDINTPDDWAAAELKYRLLFPESA